MEGPGGEELVVVVVVVVGREELVGVEVLVEPMPVPEPWVVVPEPEEELVEEGGSVVLLDDEELLELDVGRLRTQLGTEPLQKPSFMQVMKLSPSKR